DEAQNATNAQMKMFLTRFGVNSKVVITGDKTQVDLPSREESGLIQIERILPGIDGIAFHYLNDADVVRHRLVREILKAYAEDASGDWPKVSGPRMDTGRVEVVRPDGMLVSAPPPPPPLGEFSTRTHLLRLAVDLAVALIPNLLFPAAPAVNFPVLEGGAVATENVIAPFAFDVPKSSSELEAERPELARMVTPTLRFSQAAYDSSLAEL